MCGNVRWLASKITKALSKMLFPLVSSTHTLPSSIRSNAMLHQTIRTKWRSNLSLDLSIFASKHAPRYIAKLSDPEILPRDSSLIPLENQKSRRQVTGRRAAGYIACATPAIHFDHSHGAFFFPSVFESSLRRISCRSFFTVFFLQW